MKLVTAEEMRSIDESRDQSVPDSQPDPDGKPRDARWRRRLYRSWAADYRGGGCWCWSAKGNNGGDGLVAARHLYNLGAEVTVALVAEPPDIIGDARTNLGITGPSSDQAAAAEGGKGPERGQGRAAFPRPGDRRHLRHRLSGNTTPPGKPINQTG